MSESDEDGELSGGNARYLIKSEKSKTCLGSQSTTSNKNSQYMYESFKRIMRIEYPGFVKNVPAALETLGDMKGIETSVADHRVKLELHFHPNNKYNKPCVADRDTNPGILIKVERTSNSDGINYRYEVIGLTSLNFKFNRLCDFQYLPLTSDADNKQAEYMYDKILPKKLPTLKWFLAEESTNQPKFFIPPYFTKIDSGMNKLYLNTGEKFVSNLRPELSRNSDNIKSGKKHKKISIKNVSIFVNLQTPNVQIPDQPLSYTMQLVKEKKLEDKYKVVKKLFEERPVWTKVAIQYKTGISTDTAKILLPSVAYFCPIGPWRMTWLRYEYNPQKDFNSRIYQTLDYRIRAKEGTKLKVDAKRSYASKTPLKENVDSSSGCIVEERSYVLRPNYIPPARQMFYQYCDILLPEIQDMVSRLPKLPPGTKFEPKNGWLPVNFTEQCREIVNKNVMDRVQEELLEDTIRMQKQNEAEETEEQSRETSIPTYCSKMLSNIKKGIYKSVSVPAPIGQTSRAHVDVTAAEVDTIDLLEEDELEQIPADDVVNSIPERMEENSDDEHLSQGSDLDIDMEAVEDVNEMILGIKHEDEVNLMASYKKTYEGF